MQPDDCFAAGTLVQTPRGALPIEMVELGDEVLSDDGRGLRTSRVIGTYQATVSELVRVHFSDDSWVDSTPWHRFLDARGALRHARDLTIGVMVRHDGPMHLHVTQLSTIVLPDACTVFNLALDRARTFFANGKLVEASRTVDRVILPSVGSPRQWR